MFHVKHQDDMNQFNDTPLAAELSQSFQRLAEIDAAVVPKPNNCRVFTVSNQKGGVGKTTTTVNVAAALASKGLRVLVSTLTPRETPLQRSAFRTEPR